jgi:hypothetical protein
MATQVTVGKARLFSFTVITNGVLDTTSIPAVSSGNGTNMRATLNPTNSRQFAVVGLAPTSGVNANVNSFGHLAQTLISVVAAPPPPDGPTIDVADVGAEIDVPSWA